MKHEAAKVLYETVTGTGFFRVGTREFRRVHKESSIKVYEVTNPNKPAYIGKYRSRYFNIEKEKWSHLFVDDAKLTDADLSVFLVTHRITEAEKPNKPEFVKFNNNSDALDALSYALYAPKIVRPSGVIIGDLTA